MHLSFWDENKFIHSLNDLLLCHPRTVTSSGAARLRLVLSCGRRWTRATRGLGQENIGFSDLLAISCSWLVNVRTLTDGTRRFLITYLSVAVMYTTSVSFNIISFNHPSYVCLLWKPPAKLSLNRCNLEFLQLRLVHGYLCKLETFRTRPTQFLSDDYIHQTHMADRATWEPERAWAHKS